MIKSQWDCFLQNLGEWQGSFTQFSPQGEWLNDAPSVLLLEGLNDNQTVRLNLRRDGKQDLVMEYTSVGGGLKFFETGAFSQGSIQLAPFAQFGAELALLHEDRRLRLVQLFDRDGQLTPLTLIREKRAGSNAAERPVLQLSDLLGEWQGQAVTLYPDLRDPERYTTTLKIDQAGDRITQQISFASGHSIASTGTVHGSTLLFDQGSQTVQVLLLPDGASSTCPVQIVRQQPLFLEVGWLLAPNLRQRLIRSYNEAGEWVSLTLVMEQRATSRLTAISD